MHIFRSQPRLSLLAQLLPDDDAMAVRKALCDGQEDTVWSSHEEMLRVGVQMSKQFRFDVADTLVVILRVFSKHKYGSHTEQETKAASETRQELSDAGTSDMSDEDGDQMSTYMSL